MGQAMTSETLSIQGEDGFRYWVGLHAKPFHRGYKKTTYKGVLLGQGSRQWEKVSVKAFTNLPNTRANWQREIDKARETKEMVAKFKESFPDTPELTVILSCLVQMDKVSKVNRWLERRHGFSALNEDDWVSVEKHVPGPVHLYCPWSEWPPWNDLDILESEYLSTFSHFTYWASDGGLVVCDIVAAHDDTTAGYVIADVIVHSREKVYGHFDQGESGIIDFFNCHRCTELCKDWPRLADAAKQDLAHEDDDNIDTKRKVHFNLKLDKVFFARSSFKQKFPALRRHASDEGAKLRKKWMDRLSRNHSQSHPLPVKDGPPPYDDLPNFGPVQAHHRTKSWTISEFSYQGSMDEAGSRARDVPTKSCLKRTSSDQRVSLSSTDL